MQATFTTECIQATLTYPFKEPEGVKKLLVGSVLMLIGMFFPPVMILMYGYAAQAMRRIIIKGDTPSLPTWDAWDRLLRDGLKLFGAALLYTGPAWGIFLISMVIPIPCVILQILATEDMPWLNLLTLLSVVTQILGFIIGPALASLAGLFLAPAQCHIIATGRFAAAFEFKSWWPILKAALADFGIAYLLIAMMSVFVVIVTQILAITMIFCFLWPFLIAPLNTYIMVIGQTLIAQAYRAGVEIKTGGASTLRANRINRNTGTGINIAEGGQGTFKENDLRDNAIGAWAIAKSSLPHIKRARNQE